MWWLYFNVEQPVVGLVGLAGEARLDLSAVRARVEHPRNGDALERDGLDRPGPLLGSWIAGAERLRTWVGDEPLETVSRPRIEYLAPRHRLARGRSAAEENVPLILKLTALPDADLADAETLELTRSYQGALVDLLRALHRRRWAGDLRGALDSLVEALEATPDWSFLWWNLDNLTVEALRSGDHQAVARCARALESTPELTFLALHLDALEALRLGNRSEARALLERALEEEPRDQASRRLLESL